MPCPMCRTKLPAGLTPVLSVRRRSELIHSTRKPRVRRARREQQCLHCGRAPERTPARSLAPCKCFRHGHRTMWCRLTSAVHARLGPPRAPRTRRRRRAHAGPQRGGGSSARKRSSGNGNTGGVNGRVSPPQTRPKRCPRARIPLRSTQEGGRGGCVSKRMRVQEHKQSRQCSLPLARLHVSQVPRVRLRCSKVQVCGHRGEQQHLCRAVWCQGW